MKEIIEKEIKESISVKEKLIENSLNDIERATELILNALNNGGKVIIFGNGGSAADSQHIAGELIGRFRKERESIPAIALSTDTSILTSIGNDYGFEKVFSRQIEGIAIKGDVAIGISTSGNSENVLLGLKKAKEKNLKTIALTGGTGGKIREIADVVICVSATTSARIQEAHITIGHIICGLVEERFKNG